MTVAAFPVATCPFPIGSQRRELTGFGLHYSNFLI
jgi:hypothetical protein